ncbi:hypothetical protein CFC21_016190 [Triticum aestivum]|uniref:F-box domain-containing protein n=2 Tax=Triticum aestivum TaxID=4565 RepID=A0A3B6U3H1_WHEAT|nr:uncharacterized protein LOC123143453 [Triticum aestivum]KAF7000254.1 hypothetical protein CFC21_016190 [Triticum aestivum]
MTARLRRSPAASPLDDDDLLCEILLRLPPQPSSLPRASLVCKRWRRLVSDTGFSRRFRLRHRRNPPLLGFFDRDLSFSPTLEAPNRVPPGRFSLQRDDDDDDRFVPLGCRHGLVLIYIPARLQILVWDPVTADQHYIAIPPAVAACPGKARINGAVFRAAGDVQHFQVVSVMAYGDDHQHRRALACVYSSKTGLWGDPISTPLPYRAVQADAISVPTLVFADDAVLAGDSLHWLLAGNFNGILEFDLEKQRLAVIRLPEEVNCLKLVRAEGGGLGLLGRSVTNCMTQLWKRESNCDGVAPWVLGRTIDLDRILSVKPELKGTFAGATAILGLAEDNNLLLLWTITGLVVIHLESLKFKKLFRTNTFFQYHAFEGVYTAAETDIAGGHDGANLWHST